MAISRRKLFEFAPLLAAALAFPKVLFATPATILGGTGTPGDLGSMTSATFKPLVGTTFKVTSGPSGPAYLTLLSVTDSPQSSTLEPSFMDVPRPQTRGSQTVVNTYSLLFFGSGDPLAQGTYNLEHNVLGKFALFVVPGEPSNYTAVISHISNLASLPPQPKPIGPRPRILPMPSGTASDAGTSNQMASAPVATGNPRQQ